VLKRLLIDNLDPLHSRAALIGFPAGRRARHLDHWSLEGRRLPSQLQAKGPVYETFACTEI